MAKYIDREKLPQFNLYKSYAGTDDNLSWNIDFADSSKCFVKDDTYSSDIENYKSPERIDLNQILLMWHKIMTEQDTPVPVQEFIRTSVVDFAFRLSTGLSAMMKDERYVDVWKTRLEVLVKRKKHGDPKTYAEIFLALYEGLRMLQYVQLAQGCPVNVPGIKYKEPKTEYPKLLLIEADLYKKCKDADYLALDYEFLRDVLETETPVIVINGDSSEKKMFFILEHRNVSEDWGGISISRIDPQNGISQFSVMPEYSKGFEKDGVIITGQPYFCHPKGDYDCKRCEEIRTQLIKDIKQNPDTIPPCYYSEHGQTCPNKIMKGIAAVVYCYIEYKKKVLNKKSGDSEHKYITSRDKDHTQPFVPSGMIKTYDIKMTDEERVLIDKYSRYNKNGSSHASYEMSPHVRRGTMRYNPKTGQKDILVRGCIVHKDKYEGFTSADRITE